MLPSSPKFKGFVDDLNDRFLIAEEEVKGDDIVGSFNSDF
jgi:hypothetical protein